MSPAIDKGGDQKSENVKTTNDEDVVDLLDLEGLVDMVTGRYEDGCREDDAEDCEGGGVEDAEEWDTAENWDVGSSGTHVWWWARIAPVKILVVIFVE